ncbi:Alpha/Beta hydrolase protein [Desarmillaria tabescens]|uniref:Alpha/Beta hydrolase protein n=1 Tax=Armillaria tabescens TaxID=1929756 RepID=A0AA39MYA8_ARMTA|nr:Alpha/Beta hydrolase protein [Desarmillaria tabescens]KAK0450350.1 Alpha/Beta hydrolase protein [Desarmillaria tabescens]
MSGFLPSAETFAKGAFATAATVTATAAALLYYGQNYLIYPSAYISLGPEADIVESPSSFGLHYEDVDLKTSDGVTLRCYLLPQKKELPRPTRFSTIPITPLNYSETETDEEFMARRPTVIMFHGNGGNLGHRIPLGMMFQLLMRCNVLMVSYRGYGKSDGSPSEKGFQKDAQAALDYLTSDPRFSKTRIFVYGQSIGGAVAIDLVSRNPSKIFALILENTFTSLPELVPHVLPILGPFTFLCHQKWNSASKVPLIPARTPVLLLSGSADTLVPPEHMRALRELMRKRGEDEVSRWEEFPGGQHNDTSAQRGYWHAVDDFVTSLVLASEKEKAPL